MGSRNNIGTGIILALSLLTACNGGIGGTGGNDNGGGGTTNADISIGSVTALGSVEVNGVTFDTSAAAVNIDEASATDADLKQGMVVEVRGSIVSETAGTASIVKAENVIKGPITDILAGNDSQIEILGQLVEINSATVLTNNAGDVLTVANFANDELVLVSGFVKASGVIAATRIEKKDSLSDYKLKGFIVIISANTFSIGNQVVEHSGVDKSNLPGGVLTDGSLYEVKASKTFGGGGELIATRIELEDIKDSEGSEIELEGYVTDDTGAPGTFFIGSQQVQTNGATSFQGGLAADIKLGIEVEAEGQIVGGILIADEIEFESNVEVEADTTAVNAAGGTITLAVGGLVVNVNENTEISTIAGNDMLTDFMAGGGNHLQVRGNFDAGGGNIIATSVKELPANVAVSLQGPVTAKDATSITIMNIVVTPDATAEYQDASGVVIPDMAAFLMVVNVGAVVKAESDVSPPVWTKLSLEY